MNNPEQRLQVEFPTIRVGLNKIRLCKYGVIVFLVSDEVIGQALDLYGEFAEESNLLMIRLIRPGDVVVDVGANVGTVTTCMARCVGPNGKVYAIDPQRIVFQNLCATVSLNGFTNVYCIHAAVGETIGSVFLPGIDYSQRGNFGAISIDSLSGAEQVNLISIDSLELNSCRLIKIDVEGIEFEVLKGATTTIKSYQPIIYMESKKSESTRNSIEMLQELGYSLYWHFASFFRKDNFRGNPVDVFGSRGDINMLCIPRESEIKVNLPSVGSPDSDWQEEYQQWLATRSKS